MQTTGAKMRNQKGFTLVELMVTLVLTSLAVYGIYKTYISFTVTASLQDQVTEMQQGLRIGMNWIAGELRRAGYDPSGTVNPGFGIPGSNLAKADSVRFTMDITGGENDGINNDGDGDKDAADPGNDEDEFGDGDTGDIGEDITYALVANGDTFDLVRNDNNTAAGNQVLISNVDALNFVYLGPGEDTNGNGVLDAGEDEDADGFLDVDEILATPVAEPGDIRRIQVSMVIRTSNEDYTYTNTESYTNMQGTEILAPQNDNFRRRVLSREVKIRNMGLD